MKLRSLVLAAAPLLTAACGTDAESPSDSTGEAPGSTGSEATTGEPGTTTGAQTSSESGVAESSESGEVLDPNAPKFFDDVRPVFVERCAAGCHAPGGIAPYDLLEYETSRDLAELIEIVTQERSMPPFNASNTGDCNTFEAARWLEDSEMELVRDWVTGGAQQGDPDAPQPDLPQPAKLEGNDIVELRTAEDYVPVPDDVGTVDDYQCFLATPNEGDAPRYITGYEVVPGNPEVTHHMVAFLVDLEASTPLGGTNGSLIQSLDDASPDQPGWDCYGAAGQGVLPEGTPVTWAPGGGAFVFPEGTGIRVDPGYALVLQTHYNLTNGSGSDTTTVRLAMADEVEREAVNALQDKFLNTLFNGTAVEIPGGEDSFVWQWDDRLANFNGRIATWDKVEVFGLLPHMHELGNRMEAKFITGTAADPKEECAIYVDRWDFDWQQAFMYEESIILDPDDRLQVTCEWDSSNKEAATYPGLGTQDEMCLMGLYAAEVK